MYERRVQKIKANYNNLVQKSTKLTKDINAWSKRKIQQPQRKPHEKNIGSSRVYFKA